MTDLVEVKPRKQHPTFMRQIGASIAALAVAGVMVAAPLSVQQQAANAEVVPLSRGSVMNQELMAKATAEVDFNLPSVEIAEIKKPAPKPETKSKKSDSNDSATAATAAPAVPNVDPASAQGIARGYVNNDSEFACLYALWNKESRWNVSASNGSSGAYGIPQALPGSKMASAGADWQTNPDTQIRWGLGYISGRYGSPCAAWAHSQAVGWY